MNEKLLDSIVSERNKQFCELLIKIICFVFVFPQIELNGLATYMEASGSSSIDRFGPEMKTEDPTSISRSSGKMTTRFDFLPANTNFRSVHVLKFYPYFLLKKSQLELGCTNKDLWALCAPIFIILVYCRTATSYFLGYKE